MCILTTLLAYSARRVKCDELRPKCTGCTKRNATCQYQLQPTDILDRRKLEVKKQHDSHASLSAAGMFEMAIESLRRGVPFTTDATDLLIECCDQRAVQEPASVNIFRRLARIFEGHWTVFAAFANVPEMLTPDAQLAFEAVTFSKLTETSPDSILYHSHLFLVFGSFITEARPSLTSQPCAYPMRRPILLLTPDLFNRNSQYVIFEFRSNRQSGADFALSVEENGAISPVE